VAQQSPGDVFIETLFELTDCLADSKFDTTNLMAAKNCHAHELMLSEMRMGDRLTLIVGKPPERAVQTRQESSVRPGTNVPGGLPNPRPA
jgi:hypothetical protein